MRFFLLIQFFSSLLLSQTILLKTPSINYLKLFCYLNGIVSGKIGTNASVSKVRRVFSSDPVYFTDINISVSCKPDENGVNKDFLHL